MIVEKLRAIIKFFETDTQTFSKRPNPISGKYFKAF